MSTRITGTIAVTNEIGTVVPLTIDLSARASGPTAHHVSHEKFSSPEMDVNSHRNDWRTPLGFKRSSQHHPALL